MQHSINKVLLAFGLSPALSTQSITTGHLNQTLRVQTPEGVFILQKINTQVFPSVEKLMHNIKLYRHYRTPGLIQCPEYLTLASTNTPDSVFSDASGYWRIYPWIEGQSFKQVNNTEQAYACGLAYGLFNASAAPVPTEKIQMVIPGFFDLSARLLALNQAVQTCQNPNRLKAIQPILKEINTLRSPLTQASFFGETHSLPKRCIHADTKPSNVLLNPQGTSPRGVIDLDTISSYYLYYDFSDGARSTANISSEDGLDAHIDLHLLSAFSQGFMTPLREIITSQEMISFAETLPLISYMLCVRFASDYCNNDRYFRVEDPEHNLRRAQAQHQITQHLLHPDAVDCLRQASYNP